MAHILHNTAYKEYQDSLTGYFSAVHFGVDALLSDYAMAANLEGIICIVPTGRRVRWLTRLITQKVFEKYGTPAEKIQLYTLEGFIRECYQQAVDINNAETANVQQKRLMSDAYRLALFEEAIRNCVKRGELCFYSRDGSSVSATVIERIANVIYGVKKKGISIADFEQDLVNIASNLPGSEDMDRPRLQDIRAVYAEYERLRGEELLDMSALTSECTELLLNTKPEEFWQHKPLILVEGFSEFSVPEVEFLSRFAESQVPFAVLLEYSLVNGPLFGNLHEVQERLLAAGFTDTQLDALTVSAAEQQEEEEHEVAIEDARKIFKPNAAYLRRWLFNTEKEIRNDSFSHMMRILAAHDMLDEVSTIARYVRHRLVNKGNVPADIVVVMRQPENYTQLFREVFAAYDIPVNISDRFPLAKSPVIVALFAAIDVVMRGYRREDVHRALQNPYLRFRKKNGDAVDGANLYDVALRYRITGGERRRGSQGWIDRLNSSLNATLRHIAIMNSDAFADEQDLVVLQRNESALRLALEDFTTVHRMMPLKQQKLNIRDFVRLIKEVFIKQLGVQEVIDDYMTHIGRNPPQQRSEGVRLLETVEQDARALGGFLALLDEIEFVIHERQGTAKRSFEEFVVTLQAAVRGAKYQVREKQGYGVTVTTIEQTRGIPYKVMVLCGMSDKEFPASYTPETFLGKELPDTEERHIRNERMHFYHALSNNPMGLMDGSKRMLISYPQYRRGDEENVVSPFLEKLEKVTTLASTKGSTDELRAAIAADVREERRDLDWCRPWIDSIASVDDALKLAAAGSDFDEHFLLEHFSSASIEENVDYIREMLELYKEQHGEDSHVEEESEQELRAMIEATRTKPVSATDIEQYAACPYQYFASRFLHLEETKQESTALTPLERGTLMHAIAYRFYTDVARECEEQGNAEYLGNESQDTRRAVLVHLDTSNAELYRQKLLTIAHEEVERIRYEHPFFDLDYDELFGNEERIGILEQWLQAEFSRIEQGWDFVPVLFEYGFGTRAKQGGSLQYVDVGGVVLRGKIDRVEVRKIDEQHYEFLVADYKTRKAGADNNDIRRGVKFQIPLYIAATEQILKEEYGIEAEAMGGVYYLFEPMKKESFRLLMVPKDSTVGATKGERQKSQVLSSWEESRELLQTSLNHARAKVNAIAEGNFPIHPLHGEICAYCAYSSVCRIKELSQNRGGEEAEEEG